MSARADAPHARSLIEEGAQLVDVLPASIYDQERLPGAITLPLEKLDADSAASALDPQRKVVVYCFDQH
jgi:rhodanese-related sulfurtransferase